MPIINLSVAAEADPALSATLAKAVTDLTQHHLKKDPTITAVIVTYVDPVHWFAGGVSLAAQGASSYWLDIKVVDGSNTKVELAAYLEAVFQTLSALLKPVHSESYCLVHEVPASAYGFAGLTQEYRFVANKMAPAT